MLSEREKGVLAAIDAEPLYRLIAELVRRPSVRGDEKPVADFIANYLSDHGFAVDTDEIEPGRPNVTTSWGSDDGKVLLLTGHTDTVPIGEGWQHDPLGAEIVDGRLYGRGSCDMKAGLAGMMLALIAVKRGLRRPRGRIVVAGCIDGGEGGKGTQGAISAGLQADWAAIGEPTDLQPICATKGNCYFEVKIGGCGAHAGSPERGINAIYGAAEAIRAVQSHPTELSRRRHRRLGRPSDNLGTITGGLTVPH